MRITWKRAILAAMLITAITFGFIWFSLFIAQDRCLDGGGAWMNGSCVHQHG
jgi:hypothetical protein